MIYLDITKQQRTEIKDGEDVDKNRFIPTEDPRVANFFKPLPTSLDGIYKREPWDAIKGYEFSFTLNPTQAELDAIALENEATAQKNEALKYLNDTDFYMTVDKYATLTEARKLELTELRANARVIVNGVPLDVIAPTNPTVVTKAQAISALSQVGLLVTIETTIANSGDEAIQLEWANAIELRRDCISLIALAQILGITDTQLDDLFLLASGL